MSVMIDLPPDLEATLRDRLARLQQNVGTFVVEAVREKLSRCLTIDEVCAPFSEAVAKSGISDEELDQLFRTARDRAYQARQSQPS